MTQRPAHTFWPDTQPLLVSTATIIVGGIPAAIYEHVIGVKDSTDTSLWVWLAGTALLTLSAAGNFLAIGL